MLRRHELHPSENRAVVILKEISRTEKREVAENDEVYLNELRALIERRRREEDGDCRGLAVRTLVCTWSATTMKYQGGDVWRAKLLEVNRPFWQGTTFSSFAVIYRARLDVLGKTRGKASYEGV